MKHTGDGIMASFADAAASVQCARAIQQAFEAFNLASKAKLRVRIGIDVGEPIADSNDLFGATVWTALLVCVSSQRPECRTCIKCSSGSDPGSRACDKHRALAILKASRSLLMSIRNRMALSVATANYVSNEATTSAVGPKLPIKDVRFSAALRSKANFNVPVRAFQLLTQLLDIDQHLRLQ